MNIRYLLKVLGYFSWATAPLMLPALIVSFYYKEGQAALALLFSAVVSILVGSFLYRMGRGAPNRFYQRETLGVVALAWILVAGLGALPFIFSGVLGPVDAYFECMSGFTTTGSSVFGLSHFQHTPKAIMFWRAFTHWVGGMGIIVLFLAVLPYLGVGGKQLFKSESPGPDPRELTPRIRDTATILYTIYLGLTILEIAALMFAGMNWFDATCHTFATLSGGGFSTRFNSVGEFKSPVIDVIVIFFMICGATNFALYYSMLKGNWKALFMDTEWRAYIFILLTATLLVTLNLCGWFGAGVVRADGPVKTYDNPLEALRYAGFQVASMMTTTGFTTDDFDRWPDLSRELLITVMFIGGCAGSTSGGIKVIRIMMLLKMVYWRLEKSFRTRTVRVLRIAGEPVEEGVQQNVYGFVVLYLGWAILGTFVMTALGLPLLSAFTSVAATLNTTGPGLEKVGASMNFAEIPALGKLFLSLSMVLGRLELFSVLVLFVPGFWKKE